MARGRTSRGGAVQVVATLWPAAVLWICPAISVGESPPSSQPATNAAPEDARPGAEERAREGELGTLRHELRQVQLELQLLQSQQVQQSQAAAAAEKSRTEIKEQIRKLAAVVQLSGFFDVTASSYKNNPSIFALGDFELDLERPFGKYLDVAAALVFNTSGAELAVGFIDFHLSAAQREAAELGSQLSGAACPEESRKSLARLTAILRDYRT